MWHLPTPRGAASLGKDLSFTVTSVYETLAETTAKKCLLTLHQRQGESPSPFQGEAEERIHTRTPILLTNPGPHLPATELEKKKSWLKPLPIFETREESGRHDFLTEQTRLILI